MLKKAMVFTLTAAMLVGTPLTASAAPLNSVFSISDGTGTWDGHEDGSGTGTVTNTDTNSGALIGENDAKIIGISLDAQTLNLEKGDKKPLKASVVLDGKITDADENDITDDVVAEMSKKIKWEVLYVDAEGNKVTDQGDPAAKVGLELPKDWKDDRSTVQLNAKQGTAQGKEVTVRATIDAAYYYAKNESGEQNTEVLAWDDSRADIQYTAEAKVFVKEYSENLEFEGVDREQLKGHTLDLSESLVRTPATANDTITWSSSDKNVASVTAAGVVTFKKTTKEDESVTIYAVGEKGAKASQDFEVKAGVPASKVEVWAEVTKEDETAYQKVTKLTLDLNDHETEDVKVKMYAKVNGVVKSKTDSRKAAASEEDAKTKGSGYDTGKLEIENGATYYTVDEGELVENTLEITDNVTWTTNKPTIATVAGGDEEATITAAAKALGSAKITAKTSSGKKADVKVTVKATLNSLEIGGISDGDTLYSGQSVQLTALRNPALNKDSVKWSIQKVEYEKNDEIKTKANPNATINKNGVLTIKPKLDSAYTEVTVVLATKATVKNEDGVKVPVCSAEATITIEQSSMDGFTITDDEDQVVAKFETTYKDNGKVKASKQTIKNKKTYISVPKGRTYTATVQDAPGQGYAGGAETLVWTSKSNKIAKVAANGDGTATITAVAAGTTTITVSGVRAVDDEDGNIKDAKAIKATFNVVVKQPATSLTIKTPSVTVKEAKKNTNVTLKVTQNKGAKEKIEWSVVKNGEKNDSAATVSTKGKVTLKKNQYAASDVFTVTAKAVESGVTAKATIKIVTPSKAVRVVNENEEVFSYKQKKGRTGSKLVKNATTLDLGDSVTLYPQVNVGTLSEPVWQKPDTTDEDKTTAGVTYSVNKKGIVQIVGNTVSRVNKGTVKVTVKTADGKKYTLTIDDKSKEYVEPEADE